MTTGDFEIGWLDVGFKESDQELYQHLIKKESKTPFSGMMMSEVFIYSMALGYKDGKRIKFEKGEKRMPNMPPNAFTSEMRWLMRAISITENEDLEHIVDHNKVIQIAEEYANRGMQIIRELDLKSSTEYERDAVYESHLKQNMNDS